MGLDLASGAGRVLALPLASGSGLPGFTFGWFHVVWFWAFLLTSADVASQNGTGSTSHLGAEGPAAFSMKLYRRWPAVSNPMPSLHLNYRTLMCCVSEQGVTRMLGRHTEASTTAYSHGLDSSSFLFIHDILDHAGAKAGLTHGVDLLLPRPVAEPGLRELHLETSMTQG